MLSTLIIATHLIYGTSSYQQQLCYLTQLPTSYKTTFLTHVKIFFFLTLDILRNNYCHWIERNDVSIGRYTSL